MLYSRFKPFLLSKSTLSNNVQCRCFLSSRFVFKKCVRLDGFIASMARNETRSGMSSFRLILKDFSINRLWSAWTRSSIVSNVVRRCRRENYRRSVREMVQCFRQAILRPRRTLVFAATAAYNTRGEGDHPPPRCEENITDEDLEALLEELEGVEELSSSTLYCVSCGERIVIDKKHPGVRYCACKDTHMPEPSPDGWEPYMEAEDVIIWRKKYKPGKGLYAYKVYGRYKDVQAQDFAAVQVDGAYRRMWDAAVAALSVVERRANGVRDQTVLHWEVLWPRLFANRDYVYIRRHKEFDVKSKCLPHKDGLFVQANPCEQKHIQIIEERPSVHSNAKRKAIEADMRKKDDDINDSQDNKVYVIVSKSCRHPAVPETENAIRVSEYWSHMVVKTLDGVEEIGMEFVLTYYDEPAVGGLPSGVAAWATGRAAPAYLQRMRRAARRYRAWGGRSGQDLPDFNPFGPDKVSYAEEVEKTDRVNEEDMESSKLGPDMESGEAATRDQSTQTDEQEPVPTPPPDVKVVEEVKDVKVTQETAIDTSDLTQKVVNVKKKYASDKMDDISEHLSTSEEDSDKLEEEETTGGWWRYLYPFYYFV